MHRLVKIISILLILFLSFSLVGCGSTSDSTAQVHNKKSVEQEVNIPKEKESPLSNNNRETVAKNTSINTASKQSNSSESNAIEQKNTRKESTSEKNKTNTSEPTQNTEVKNQDNQADQKPVNNTTKTAKVPTTTDSKKLKPVQDTVTLKIVGSKQIGIILEKKKVTMKDGDTVLDILLKAAKQYDFDVEYSGSGAMAYIEGIDNVYEFDYGPKSGWNFNLNGTMINKSSDLVKVKKDDYIEWIYSEDFTLEQ